MHRFTAATIALSGAGLLGPALGQDGSSARQDSTVAGAAQVASVAAPQASESGAGQRDVEALGDAVAAAVERGAAASATLRRADGTWAGSADFVVDPRGHGTVVVVRLRLAVDWRGQGTFHGFHVHANDDPTNGSGCQADPDQPASTWFASADGHYAAPGQQHGHHRGDLPALYVQRGGASEAVVVTDRFRPRDVVGRAIIVHANPDNFANIPVGPAPDQYRPNSPEATSLTDRTGNAGDRILCGVIRR